MAKDWNWNAGDDVAKLPRALRKYAPVIDSLHTEDDGCFEDARGRRLTGIWLYLIEGVVCHAMECGSVHESSIARIAEQMDHGIGWDAEVENLVECLLTLEAPMLAVLGDMAEEGGGDSVMPVAAWEDGGAEPMPYRVAFSSQWARESGTPHPSYRYVKAYSPEGAVKRAQLHPTDELVKVEVSA